MMYPHSPDAERRLDSDMGFSEGWGMHFMPVEEYWTDLHTHLDIIHEENTLRQLDLYKRTAEKYGFKSAAMVTRLLSRNEIGHDWRGKILDDIRAMQNTRESVPLLYMDYKDPDPAFLEEAIQAGIKGVKLHNAPVIIDGASCEVWLSDEWRAVFHQLETFRLPILWHVTQRLTPSPYSGGEENTYWKQGWAKGITYTNQDLLDVFLDIVSTHPMIHFIGAHQLHMGWPRISKLFEKHANLAVDTSCGCIVRDFDQIYEADRDYLREFFIRFSDRIFFGTDTVLQDDSTEDDIRENFENHMRFIRQLRLPHAELQNIVHSNFDHLFGTNEPG